MGLRMFDREPAEAADKPAVRNDPTAPARSAIRRQRTIRHSPATRPRPSFPSSSNAHQSRDGHSSTRLYVDRRSLSGDIRRREGAMGRAARAAAAAAIRREMPEEEPAYQSSLYAHAADVAHIEASQRNRLEGGQALLRDAMSYEPRSERTRISRNSTVPFPPESFRPIYPSDPARPLYPADPAPIVNLHDPRHAYMVVHPQYPGTWPASSTAPVRDTAPLTSRFAPAYRLSEDAEDGLAVTPLRLANRAQSLAVISERLPILRHALSEPEDRASLDALLNEIEQMRNRDPNTLTATYLRSEAEYLNGVGTRLNMLTASGSGGLAIEARDALPPLQRTTQAGNEEERILLPNFISGEGDVNGLGDRERSFSPEHDAWETLQLTIPYDGRVPTAASSFTSATASAPSSSHLSDSATSSSSRGTIITAPSSATTATTTAVENDLCPADNSELDDNEALEEIAAAAALEEDDDDDEDDDAVGGGSGSSSSIPHHLYRGAPSSHLPHSSTTTQRLLQRSDSQIDRIEDLSRRLEAHRERHGDTPRYRHLLERELELRRLERDLRRLEGQIAIDRHLVAERQRPEERL